MKKKAFLFDLDGVIVDTAKYHYLAWKHLAKEIGFEFTEVQNEQFKGVSRVQSLELLLKMGGKTATQDQKDKWLKQKNVEYLTYIESMDAGEILPDVTRILEYLEANDQAIALGSASKNARPILDKVGLRDKFEAIIDGTNVTRAKPDPEVFTKGATALGVSYTDCIVFEDSIAGIQAANSVGMTSIGIGDPVVLQEADFVFRDFTELSNTFLETLITN